MAALSYTQNFDGLSDGNLSGQDSWSASSGSGMTVQGTHVIQGTKTLKNDTPNNGDNDYRRTVSTFDSMDFFFSFQVSDAAGNKNFQMRDNGGAGTVSYLTIPEFSGGGFSGDTVTIQRSTTVASTFSLDTTYYVNWQLDDAAQNNLTRARVWKPGSGWGSWTSWVATAAAYTSCNQIRIDCGGGDGTGGTVCYFDEFQETDPVPSVITKECSDTTTTTDAIARSVARIIAESTTNTDAITTVKVLSQTVSDTLALTDSVLRTAGKSILETLALTDTVVRGATKVVLDALAMAAEDVVITTKVAVTTITDALAMAAFDTVITATVFARTILDTLGMSDSVTIRSLWAPRSKPTSTWTPRSKS